MKSNTNVRIYKSVFFDKESTVYTTKTSDSRGSGSQPTLKGVAVEIKEIHDKLESLTQLTVDFKPFHDLECPDGLTPHRCLPLSEEEQNQFWFELGKLF